MRSAPAADAHTLHVCLGCSALEERGCMPPRFLDSPAVPRPGPVAGGSLLRALGPGGAGCEKPERTVVKRAMGANYTL